MHQYSCLLLIIAAQDGETSDPVIERYTGFEVALVSVVYVNNSFLILSRRIYGMMLVQDSFSVLKLACRRI